MTGSRDLSVVVPVRDEAESIDPLARELEAALSRTGGAWEVIWVDDGSTDGTAALLEALHAREPRHRFLRLDRRCGQSAALVAGFREARMDLLATLDGDGQIDPADLPPLLDALLSEGADLVQGYRRERMDSATRRLSSRVANAFRNLALGESVRDVGCSLRVMRRACVEGIPLFGGTHRFLPALVRAAGFDRIIERPVGHRPRTRGVSKYGIGNRLWVGIADTLGVAWLRRRSVAPRVAARSTGQAQRRPPCSPTS